MKPKVASKTPLPIKVKAGEKYFWCSCGESSNQPFCDGAHKGSTFVPKLVIFDTDKEVWWCGCKHTSSENGLCDGAHKQITD